MALHPPQYEQPLGYSAREDRQLLASLVQGPGVVGGPDFGVSAGSGMNSLVVAGKAYVAGTTDYPDQGLYHVWMDANTSKTHSAAHASLPRIDSIYLVVNDSDEVGGGTDDAEIRLLTGTPTSGANLTNRSGAAAWPTSALFLGDQLVHAGDTSAAFFSYGDKREWTGAYQGVLTSILPSSAFDGQVINVSADPTNGVIWRFRYRAASASAHKWEFIGGPPLFADVLGVDTTQSTSYTTLTGGSAGPTLSLPASIGGDFDVEIGARISSAVRSSYMSYDIGATPASDNDSITLTIVETFGGQANVSRVRRKTGLAAGTTLTSKYRTSNADTAAGFAQRFMSIRPVRCG